MSKRRRVFKIVLLGDGGVGKTSLLHRYLGKGFTGQYKMTLGAEFSIKRMGNDVIQIWDLAGQPTFSTVRKSYYVGGVGALILFDVTNRNSLENVMRWAEEIISNTGYPVPLMLVGNKIDLRETHPDAVTTEEGIKLATKLSAFLNCPVNYTGASAKTGLYVDGIFEDFISWSTSPSDGLANEGITIRSIPEYHIETDAIHSEEVEEKRDIAPSLAPLPNMEKKSSTVTNEEKNLVVPPIKGPNVNKESKSEEEERKAKRATIPQIKPKSNLSKKDEPNENSQG